ncbi:MAG: PAS domain S-box protein [Balneolaceae bacterium]
MIGFYSNQVTKTQRLLMPDNLFEYLLKEEKILESLPAALFITDKKGRVKYYNSAMGQLLNCEPELNSGHWYGNSTLYHPDGTPIKPDENPVALFLKKADQPGGAGDVVIAVHPDGTRTWLKIYSSRLYNEDGETAGTSNMVINVSNEQEIEQHLRHNEEELVDFFDNAAVGLHQTRADGIIIRANKAILELLGYSREEFVGKHIAEFVIEKPVLDDVFKTLSADEEIRDYEVSMRHKDGSVRHLLLNSAGYQKDGEFIHSQCITRDITEQKIAEAALRDAAAEYNRQERLYDAIISSTPDLVYVFDLDYRFKFANDALLQMWGLTKKEECIGKGLREVGYEEWHAEMHEREIDQVIATKAPVQGEVSFLHSSLGKRLYDYILVPVLNSNHEVEAVAGTTRDITRRNEAEKALQRNEEKYRTLVENFPKGAVGLFDKDLRYTAVGGELVTSAGVDPKDRIGHRISDIYPKEIVDLVEKYFREALKGKANSFEADMHDRHLFAQTLPVKNDKGEIQAGMLVVQDITERWQARLELHKSEEKYRSLFERMDEGFAVIQVEFDENNEPVNFHYLETNPAYHKHSGLENVVGRSAKEVIPNAGKEMLERNGRVALTGEPFQGEVYVKELDRWFDLSTFRVGEPEEHKVAVIFTNITQRKQAQKKLELMNETLEERVKQRTQSLLAYQDKLRSLAFQLSRTEEKQRQQLATELHDNLGQLLALGNMKINQLQYGQFAEEIAPVVDELKKVTDEAIRYTRELTSDLKPPRSVSNDIRSSLNWLAEKFAEHGLTVTIDDDEKNLPLDEEMQTILMQSVRELLFNVVKHTSVNKALVRLQRSESYLQIAVEDEGEGFDLKKNELASITNGRFGLFSIQERIDLLGGRMDIESETGRGTTITLSVPFSEDAHGRKKLTKIDEEGRGKITKLKPEKRSEKTKVLLVDDHKMFRNGLRKIIEEEDDFVVVGEAGNGEDAITLSRENSPDVILMDVTMPEMDGIEATKLIKTGIPDVRIIGVSLHDSKEIEQDMRDAGASAFLTKTEAFESLIATIRAEVSATKE